MRTDTLLVSAALALLFSCGVPTADAPCQCDVPTAQGNLGLACGQSQCVAGVLYGCSGATPMLETLGTCQPACTPKVCGGAGSACGSVDDGCGGTLTCGGCSAGQSCQGGACVADVCHQAGAVCGTLQGVNCGTCPGTSTCASTGKACVEHVASLPFAQYVSSSVLAGDTLYVAGPRTVGATTYDLVAVTLSTGAVQSVATALPYSPHLTSNGASVFWSTSTGISRVAAGSTTVEAVPNFSEGCTTLLADGAHLFCGQGGDATYGVQFWGVRMLPLAGGPASWLVQDLNFPHMALSGGMLFTVGTTDNYYSFSLLSVTYLSDGTQQSIASGGSLDSSFVMADAHGYYFVQQTGSSSTLTRAPFNNTPSVDLFTGQGFQVESTVLTGTEVWTLANLGGQQGLWKVATSGSAPVLVVRSADLGSGQSSTQGLFHAGQAWVVTAGTSVYRLHDDE